MSEQPRPPPATGYDGTVEESRRLLSKARQLLQDTTPLVNQPDPFHVTSPEHSTEP